MSRTEPREQLTRTIQGALFHAAEAFSELVEAACSPTASKIVMQNVSDLPSLLGSAEEPMTGVLLTLRRDLGAFCCCSCRPASRHLGRTAPRPHGWDGRCALRPWANWATSWAAPFITRRRARDDRAASRPKWWKIWSAVLSTVGAYLALHGQPEFPVIQTTFRARGLGFGAYLLWLPEALQQLGERH